jgi:hypothetical protein
MVGMVVSEQGGASAGVWFASPRLRAMPDAKQSGLALHDRNILDGEGRM